MIRICQFDHSIEAPCPKILSSIRVLLLINDDRKEEERREKTPSTVAVADHISSHSLLLRLPNYMLNNMPARFRSHSICPSPIAQTQNNSFVETSVIGECVQQPLVPTQLPDTVKRCVLSIDTSTRASQKVPRHLNLHCSTSIEVCRV
jgi:hypothetical protein